MKMPQSRLLLIPVLTAAILTGCSPDPNVAKRRYVESGDRYAAAQKYREAVLEYRNAIQQDASFGEARYKLAGVYLELRDMPNALREYVRAADLLPDDVEAQLWAAKMLVLSGDFGDAKTRADKALEKDPRNVEAQILRGNALAGLKDLDAAISQISEAIALDPDRGVSHANLGMMELVRGNREEAESSFKKAVELDSTSVLARLALANFYWATGNTAAAQTALQDALALDPRHVVANRAMAMLHLASGTAAEAEPYLKALAEIAGTADAQFALARFYALSKRWQEATGVLNALRSNTQTGDRASLELAKIALAQGQVAAAESTVDGVLAAKPDDVDAMLIRAAILVQQQRRQEALALAERAVSLRPSSIEAQFSLGRLLAANQRPEDAKRAFNAVLALNPGATSAQLELAKLHLASGATETSVSIASEVAAREPHNSDASLVLARGLVARRDFVRAETVLRQLVASFPRSAAVHSQLGIVAAMKGDRAAAAQEFELALEANPFELEAIGGLSLLDIAAGRRTQATERLDRLIEQAPNNAGLLTLAARTRLVLRDAPAAEDLLRRAIAADPAMLVAYTTLGQVYLSERRLDDALTTFQALAKRQSPAVPALTMVGMIQQMQGRDGDARATFEKVLQLDSRAAVAANNLAWIYAEQGDKLDAALQLAQTAKAALPDQPEVDDTLGWVYYKRGLYPLAVSTMQRSVDKAPTNAVFHYHLGLAHAKNGDPIRAKHSLAEALKLQADFDGASEAARVMDEL
jgi:putative PEP-CTERM system TPR-repeat lipoprotein